MTQLEQQVEAAKKERGEQGLWTRLTTKDEKSQQAKAESDAKAMEHDQQDARRDAQATGRRRLGDRQGPAVRGQGRGDLRGAARGWSSSRNSWSTEAAGWGEGSGLFTRIRRIVEYGQRANANDLDAEIVHGDHRGADRQVDREMTPSTRSCRASTAP
ncbi:MAG: hypothetical protein IPM79_31825 [Polyangiaceae bacterium]|nr:hypothetical protein [Polyangiaceae bacterium]